MTRQIQQQELVRTTEELMHFLGMPTNTEIWDVELVERAQDGEWYITVYYVEKE